MCRMHSARNEQPLRSWGAAGLWPARPRAHPLQLASIIVSSLCMLGRWSEPTLLLLWLYGTACRPLTLQQAPSSVACMWLVECADEPSGARRFFFSVYTCTLCGVAGLASYGHKKAPQGVNLARRGGCGWWLRCRHLLPLLRRRFWRGRLSSVRLSKSWLGWLRLHLLQALRLVQAQGRPVQVL